MRFTVYLFAFAAVAFAQDLSIEEEDIEMHLNVPEYKQKVQELTVKAEQLLAMTPEETEEMNSIKAELPDYTPVEAAPGVDENIDTINARSAIKDEFFEGDVILTTQQLESLRMFNNQTSRARRQAQTGPNFPRNQWETLVIPFSFAPGYPSSGIAPIRAAAKFWSDNTCVKFQENAAGNDRVEFIYGNGCYSYIGRVGNKQQVSIGNGCEYKGTVVHELGHTLGLYHTQSRYDRRNYVYVDNTQVGVKDINFVETTAKETDNYGLPYEYTSVMHYGAFDMGRNGKPVMIASRGYEMYQYAMGQRFATFNDVRLVNKYYKCTEKKCPNARLACQNGGYVDPNNCNQCKCPQGWGGQLCNAKPTTGCYKEIQVNGRGSIKVEASNSNKVDFAECTYVFIAPQGRRVGIQVRDLKSTAIRNCFFGGIEIQTRADPTYAGTTFCDQNTPTLSQVLASDTNRLTITARDISYGTSATIDYYAA